MIIIKRNGDEVPFDGIKIIDAINKAFKEVDGEIFENDTATDIAIDIYKKVENSSDRISVETIQDWVEEYLMRSERPDVARAYIRYRYKKEVARKHKSDFIAAIDEKLRAKNVKNQNANVDEKSFGGRMGEANSYMTKQFALDYCMSEKSRNNHLNNRIYIHDLDHYAVGDHNCLSIPFDDLLAKGFNTRQGDIRPAGSAATALQLVAVIFQLQSLQQFGGVSATHLDWTMVPYIRKSFRKHWNTGLKYLAPQFMEEASVEEDLPINDYYFEDDFESVYKYAMEMTEKEVKESVQALYHNLNTLQSRSGNQLKWMAG